MIRTKLLLLALLVCVAVPAFAQTTFLFDLTGSQEVPPVSTTATGGCYAELNEAAATLNITCVHNVVNATVMHIHRAPAGANGAIAFDLGDPSSGVVTATWSGMTPADIADLQAGNLYVNIHTAGRPAGEIRGQILPRTVDTVAFTADGSQVVPPGSSPSSASCTANLNDPGTALDIQCTHTMAAATDAHVHQAPAGVNGPVVFTFPSPASPLIGSMPMTARLLADFAARFLYLEIHGGVDEETSDVIRGQIGMAPVQAQAGTVIIEKLTYPAGGLEFGFSSTLPGGAFFTLDHGQTRTFTDVATGTYTVTEGPGGDFTLADIRCNDANSSGDVSSRTATINLEAGETVRCTFRNFESEPGDQIFVFQLSPAQEVPPVVGTERGGCMARFDTVASELTFVCTHNVDLPTAIHVHRAPAGENGPIVFDLGQPASPILATWTMTPADVADLFAGNLYVNIHTAGRPAGAARGQIVERGIDTVYFPLDASQVVPPGATPSTGNCTADLDDPATGLAVSCTHNLPSPSAAHLHEGERGSNGPIVFTFPSPVSPINAVVPMTPRNVADFAAELLYIDIHGTGSGEGAEQIRGQVATPAAAPTTGTIRVVKSTSPAGGSGFGFTSNIPGGAAFTLNDTQVQTFFNVAAGTYTVTESAMAGWSLTDVVCTDTDSSGNPFNRTASIVLSGGETVTCTFRNLRAATAPQQFVFHLSADQEVPPTNSTARGGCYGELDQPARTFSVVCTHNVDSPQLVHIHRAPIGQNGPIVFDLGDPVSPIEATWTNMTDGDLADLLAGNLYVNIHASGRPAGEIRGQILPRTVDAFDFPASGAQEVPPTDSSATGNCSADLAGDASTVFVQCTHDVNNVTDIHLHAAPPGRDGPIVFDFPNTSTFSGNVPLTPRMRADFAAGFLYVNVHSTLYETGEIRGNLIAGPLHQAVAHIPTAAQSALMMLALTLAVLALRRI